MRCVVRLNGRLHVGLPGIVGGEVAAEVEAEGGCEEAVKSALESLQSLGSEMPKLISYVVSRRMSSRRVWEKLRGFIRGKP
jgi:hypothetical protein